MNGWPVFPGLCVSNRVVQMRGQQGLTLIEVAVAVAIMAIVATLSYQSLNVATSAGENSEAHIRRLEKIDRTWLLLETDLRNALGFEKKQLFEGSLPAMSVAFGEDYTLSFLRGGNANPLNFVRSEAMRVGYRLEEDTLWRHSWVDPANMEFDQARRQKLVDDVENITVRALSKQASSVAEGPWLESWPPNGGNADLPLAVEVTLTLKDRGEIKRLFAMLPGN